MTHAAVGAAVSAAVLAIGGCTGGDAASLDQDSSPYVLTPDQALRAAVVRGDRDGAASALAASADVDVAALSTTALHIAIERGDRLMAELLLGAGADVQAPHRGLYQPLHLAAAAGDVDMMRTLIEAGADPDGRDSRGLNLGETPLALAATRGMLDAMQELIRAGADVDRASQGRGSPLFEAACAGQLASVRLLTGWGADADVWYSWAGSAAECAITEGHPGVADYLQSLD